MPTSSPSSRRTFLQKTTGVLTGLGLGIHSSAKGSPQSKSLTEVSEELPNNPLVLFDNFHVGNRRSYSWKAKFAAAEKAGFDGYEFAGQQPGSDSWKAAMDLAPQTNFKLWGFHMTTQAVIDKNAGKIDAEIERIVANVETCGQIALKPYVTLSLSGNDELRGPTIPESGSAKAEERHWQRAYQIIAAFDRACQEHQVTGSLYPHTHWVCDTPQSQVKILEGANAQTIGPAFCAHHWYANKNAKELDEVLQYPIMKRLNYVVLTNGRFQGNRFPAVRFDEGEIDMAWMLAKIYELGYDGPISSQGWAIGGDPFVSGQRFVQGIEQLRKRFQTQPELWPLR